MLIGKNYRVADAAFEGLELLAGRPARAVLRGLGAGDSPRLLGVARSRDLILWLYEPGQYRIVGLVYSGKAARQRQLKSDIYAVNEG